MPAFKSEGEKAYFQEMDKPLGQLFWGYFLILININLFGFDVLPDFVGYWMVHLALMALCEKKGLFSRLRWLPLILAGAAVAESGFSVMRAWSRPQWPLDVAVAEPQFGVFVIIEYITMISYLILFGLILKGLCHLAEAEGNGKTSASAAKFSRMFLRGLLPAAMILKALEYISIYWDCRLPFIEKLYPAFTFFLFLFHLLAALSISVIRWNLYGQKLDQEMEV